MRPRSRRVLAQRKFAQGAYVPPSAAPAPPSAAPAPLANAANGERHNHPNLGSFHIQHAVCPSVFVDYISYHALEIHHRGLQPYVMVKRLDLPPNVTVKVRTEHINNRELIRNRELDKNRDIQGKKTKETPQTSTNRESGRNKDIGKSKQIATNKDSKTDTTSKENVKNKSNLRKTATALKELINKSDNESKNSIKKKDVTKSKSNKTNEKNTQSKRLKPECEKKPKLAIPVHVMSLRSRRQIRLDLNSKAVTSRVTTRLAAARRKVAKKIEEPAKQEEKKRRKSVSSLKTPRPSSPTPSEFSVDDNRPLTYFAKCSTPKRAPSPPPQPVSSPQRVSSVANAQEVLSAATAHREPSAAPAQQVPFAAPAQRVPSAAPTQRVSFAVPAQREPSAAPAQREPSAAPAQRVSFAVPAQRVPSAAPAQRRSSGAACQRRPSVATGQRRPSVATGQQRPSMAPAQRRPSVALARVPSVVSVQRLPSETVIPGMPTLVPAPRLSSVALRQRELSMEPVPRMPPLMPAPRLPSAAPAQRVQSMTHAQRLLPLANVSVALVPITTASTVTEPEAGPSKITEDDTLKTKPVYVLLPNIASSTEPEQTSPFYSTPPSIYQWMNKSLDEGHSSQNVQKTNPASLAAVQTKCPALRWITVKDVTNANKAQLESRCFQCNTCRRIQTIMQLSETLQRHANYASEEDNDEDDLTNLFDLSTPLNLELVPKCTSVLHVYSQKFNGKTIIFVSLIPRTSATGRMLDFTLEDQEIILNRLKRRFAKRSCAAEHSGVMRSGSEAGSSCDELLRGRSFRRLSCSESICSDMSTPQPLLQPLPQRPLLQRKRRQSVCPELAMQAGTDYDSPEELAQPRPQRQRRKSVCAELACQENLNSDSEEMTQMLPQRQRRARGHSATEHTQQKSKCAEKARQSRQQRQRRRSVGAELGMQKKHAQQQSDSEEEIQPRPQRQRRQSAGAAEAMIRKHLFRQELDSEEETSEFEFNQSANHSPLLGHISLSQFAPQHPVPRLPHPVPSSDLFQVEFEFKGIDNRPKSNLARQPKQHVSNNQETTDTGETSSNVDLRTTRKKIEETKHYVEKNIMNVDKNIVEKIGSDSYIKAIDDAFGKLDPVETQDIDVLKTPTESIDEDMLNEAEKEDRRLKEQEEAAAIERIKMSIAEDLSLRLLDVERRRQSMGEPLRPGPSTAGIEIPEAGGSSRSSVSLHYEESVDGASEAQMIAEVDAQAKALEKEMDAKGENAPDMGHSSGTDPGASSGFPSSADGAQIVDAPVFRPTMEEFDDPIAFFEKILPIAAKYGICKIVPPEGWEPKSKINEDIRFDVTNQYISRLFCRWGPASRELSALKLCLQQQNVNVTRPPLVDGVEVNLPKLYHLVQRHGGLENVINKKRWSKVAEEMRLHKSPVIERKLDQLYVKYLLPYATLDHQERQEIMKKVEMGWHHKNQKLLDRATNPLHRQKRMRGESESSDGETEDEGTSNALADAEDCVVPGLCMNFVKFKKVATNAYENYFGTDRPDADMPSIEVIEDRYWRFITTGTEHLCVYCAAIDTGEEGHGFTKDKSEPFGSHPWNLKMFSENLGNILRYLGPVLGMTVPTLHLGMIFSTSCWHKDPHALPWTEFMFTGLGRIWYGIPDEQSDNFRKAVETLTPTSCQNKSLWLPSDIAMIPPSILREHNVSLSRTEQFPGEFILVFPKAYSCSISTGYTESESVYFAPRSWLENLEQVIKETRESCEPTMFSLEQLIICMCKDPDIDPDLLKMVHPLLDQLVRDEVKHRELLFERGLKFLSERDMPSTSKSKPKASTYGLHEQDECDYCRATLYMSKVRGLTGKKSALCLEHALLLLDSPKYKEVNVGQLEVFVYITIEELTAITASVETRIGAA